MLATLGNTMSARNIIEIIDDSESDLDSSDADDHIPVGVEEWIRDTEASQSSMQYFDSERNKWTTKDNDLSDDFFQELRKMAENEDVNGPGTQADEMIEDTMYVSEAGRQDESSNMAFNGQHINTDAVIEGGVATSLNGLPREGQNLNELLADVLRMHGEPRNSELDEDKDTKYEYCWTGM